MDVIVKSTGNLRMYIRAFISLHLCLGCIVQDISIVKVIPFIKVMLTDSNFISHNSILGFRPTLINFLKKKLINDGNYNANG